MWAEQRRCRNWRRIPDYVRWMSQCSVDMRAHNHHNDQRIIARLLDIVMTETSNDDQQHIGLSTFGREGAFLIDNLGRIVPSTTDDARASISLLGRHGTYFFTPVIDRDVLLFPVHVLPMGGDNEGGAGTRIFSFEFRFQLQIFQDVPTSSLSTYTLYVRDMCNMVDLVQDTLQGQASAHDRATLLDGLMDLLKSLTIQYDWSKTAGFKSICAELMLPVPVPNDPVASSSSSQSVKAVSTSILNIDQIEGQYPVLTWTPLSQQRGFSLQMTVHNVYLSDQMRWCTVSGANRGLAKNDLNNQQVRGGGQEQQQQAPVIVHSISDFILFTMEGAKLAVKQRSWFIQRNEHDSKDCHALL